jgi:cyanate permease
MASPRFDKQVMEPYHTGYRWVMLALVSILYWVFGVLIRSPAPLVTPILEDLKISYSQMGFILASWPLTYILIAAGSGAILDRWGIRKSLFIGVVIIGLSEVLRYFATGFVSMVFCVALLGLGGPMISVGCPKTISMWFRGKERGIAVGIYTSAVWIGGLTAYSTANSVIMPLTGYSWRLTFVCYSLPAFAAAMLWWLLARDPTQREASEQTGIVRVFSGLIGTRNVQIVLIMGFLSFAVAHGFNDWLPKILETGGLSPKMAGFAASIPLAVAIPTLFAVPRLIVPRSRGKIIALMALTTAIAVMVVATTWNVFLIAGLVLYGVSFCTIIPLSLLILMELPEVSSRYMGSAGGMFFCIGEIGGFAGPFIIGGMRDLTGNFLLGAVFLASLSVTISVLGVMVRPGLSRVYERRDSMATLNENETW